VVLTGNAIISTTTTATKNAVIMAVRHSGKYVSLVDMHSGCFVKNALLIQALV
jgi:hypothetical protein